MRHVCNLRTAAKAKPPTLWFIRFHECDLSHEPGSDTIAQVTTAVLLLADKPDHCQRQDRVDHTCMTQIRAHACHLPQSCFRWYVQMKAALQGRNALILDGAMATELERVHGMDLSSDHLWSAKALHSSPQAIKQARAGKFGVLHASPALATHRIRRSWRVCPGLCPQDICAAVFNGHSLGLCCRCTGPTWRPGQTSSLPAGEVHDHSLLEQRASLACLQSAPRGKDARLACKRTRWSIQRHAAAASAAARFRGHSTALPAAKKSQAIWGAVLVR